MIIPCLIVLYTIEREQVLTVNTLFLLMHLSLEVSDQGGGVVVDSEADGVRVDAGGQQTHGVLRQQPHNRLALRERAMGRRTYLSVTRFTVYHIKASQNQYILQFYFNLQRKNQAYR